MDTFYMQRALELAGHGAGRVSPNPMVGAVIVSSDNRVLGEGWHRKYGEAHAEVNAMRSVAEGDLHLLGTSTMYVTLEPCSHHGKTPPCAEMLCRAGIGRVVIGTEDPNPKVAGRGIRMLREAGIEVTTDVLADECRALNARFFTAHTKKRPWILLKWAEDIHGEMSGSGGAPLAISTPLTSALMHAQRAMTDAILVGTDTLLADNPSLTTRLWPGHSPRPVVFESERLADEAARSRLEVFRREPVILDPAIPLEENMHLLYSNHGITSLMVEGGRTLLASFLEAGLYDRIRLERACRQPSIL